MGRKAVRQKAKLVLEALRMDGVDVAAHPARAVDAIRVEHLRAFDVRRDGRKVGV